VLSHSRCETGKHPNGLMLNIHIVSQPLQRDTAFGGVGDVGSLPQAGTPRVFVGRRQDRVQPIAGYLSLKAIGLQVVDGAPQSRTTWSRI